MLRRFYSKGVDVLPGVKGTPQHKVRVDQNLPKTHSRLKAWQRDGAFSKEAKDEWFKLKYKHANKRRERTKLPGKKDAGAAVKPVLRIAKLPFFDYVFGLQAVRAVLAANHRLQFGVLYVHGSSEAIDEVCATARDMEIPVKHVELKMQLDLVVPQHAPHNGVVLEASPLASEEVVKMGTAHGAVGRYVVVQNAFHQQLETTVDVVRHDAAFAEHETRAIPVPNAELVRKEEQTTGFHEHLEHLVPDETQETFAHTKLYPLGIYLDQVTDPMNMGALIRSAYYLGADFVVVSKKNCAPLLPTTLKALAGAMEFMKVYATASASRFFDESREHGWQFVAATTPEGFGADEVRYGSENPVARKLVEPAMLPEILHEGPTILVLGLEGHGLRTQLKLRCKYVVQLGAMRREARNTVDSLNVSVAGALLMAKTLGV